LETVGVGGLRLVRLESLLKYARRCARRVARIRRRHVLP
jgi:predicted RNA-binding protein Jag